MWFDASTLEALALVAAAGAVVGLLAGLLASADSLIGTTLMGVIGALAVSTIARLAGAPPVYGVGDDFSLVWGAAGGLLLAFVVGRTNV